MTRTCEECERPLVRRFKTSDTRWAGQRFCSDECRQAEWNRRRNEAKAEQEGPPASDLLNARMWRMYERVANERGLAHPLIAAVQLGMRG